MFGMHHTLKQLSVGVAAAASVAIVAVPSALATHDTWYRNAVRRPRAGRRFRSPPTRSAATVRSPGDGGRRPR